MIYQCFDKSKMINAAINLYYIFCYRASDIDFSVPFIDMNKIYFEYYINPRANKEGP